MSPIISSKQKSQCHSRSVSFPSTSDQQSIFNEFYQFQASQEATTSGSSSSSSSPSCIANKLNRLNDMYDTIHPLLTLPTTQQSLAQECHKEKLNKLLDELVGLLDLFATTKDVVSLSIDSVKELQSGVRRKRGDNHGLTSSVKEYLSQRTKVKKIVCKALSGLRKQCSSSIKEDQITPSNIMILKEMRLKTLSVFESLLTTFLGSNSELKPKGWSLVSKMMGNKHLQCDHKVEENKVKKVDNKLHSNINCKNTKSGSCLDVNTIQMGLAELELHLLDLDEDLDSLCKHLIKTRVSILNILNF